MSMFSDDDKVAMLDPKSSRLVIMTRKEERSAMGLLAGQLSDIFGLGIAALDPEDPAAGGYAGLLVKEAANVRIEIQRQLVNWRLAEVPAGEIHPVARRFWCYGGLDMMSLLLATTNAVLLDGTPEATAVGWSRKWPESGSAR